MFQQMTNDCELYDFLLSKGLDPDDYEPMARDEVKKMRVTENNRIGKSYLMRRNDGDVILVEQLDNYIHTMWLDYDGRDTFEEFYDDICGEFREVIWVTDYENCENYWEYV